MFWNAPGGVRQGFVVGRCVLEPVPAAQAESERSEGPRGLPLILASGDDDGVQHVRKLSGGTAMRGSILCVCVTPMALRCNVDGGDGGFVAPVHENPAN